MRTSAVMVLTVGSVFALTAAGASGLGTLTGGKTISVVNSGSIDVTTTSCTDNIDVQYLYADSQTRQTITGLRLTAGRAATSTCEGLTATVTLSDNGATYTRTGATVFAPVDLLGFMTERAIVDLSEDYDVSAHPLKLTSISVS